MAVPIVKPWTLAHSKFLHVCRRYEFRLHERANIGRHFGEPSAVPEHYVAETTSYEPTPWSAERGADEKYYPAETSWTSTLDEPGGRTIPRATRPRPSAPSRSALPALFGELDRLVRDACTRANLPGHGGPGPGLRVHFITTPADVTDNRRRFLRWKGCMTGHRYTAPVS